MFNVFIGTPQQDRQEDTLRPDGMLNVIVEDNGDGVKDDAKDLIFNQGCGRNTDLRLTLSRGIPAVTGIEITGNGVCGGGARSGIRNRPPSWRSPAQECPA